MPAKTKKTAEQSAQRVRKLDYKSKKKSVKINEPIPSSLQIFKYACRHIWQNKKLFAGIIIIYAVLYILLVKGLANNFQLAETRKSIEASLDSNIGSLTLGAALLGSLLGTANTASTAAASVYQVILFIILSLALIWSLRQTYESPKPIKTRQAYYQGMYPLVPYILVWLVILLQLLPALIGISVYNLVSANGIAVGTFENILWVALVFLLVGASIFLTSSSIFATYVVALPNIAPMQALKKARKIVKFRRFAIIRKLLFLPLVLIVFTIALFLPMVLYATFLAEVVFLIYTMAVILFSHAYVYNLYRKLI